MRFRVQIKSIQEDETHYFEVLKYIDKNLTEHSRIFEKKQLNLGFILSKGEIVIDDVDIRFFRSP